MASKDEKDGWVTVPRRLLEAPAVRVALRHTAERHPDEAMKLNARLCLFEVTGTIVPSREEPAHV